ncbi:hypothetical protein Tco_1075230 [Tanacetum coccineum]
MEVLKQQRTAVMKQNAVRFSSKRTAVLKQNAGEASDDMEKLGDELARLGLTWKCCLVLGVPRLDLETKEVMWPLSSQVKSLKCLCDA